MASKKAATETALGELHAQVATGLTDILRDGVELVYQGAVTGIVERPAAYFTAAIAFLKNNNITATPEQSDALANLREALQAKREAAKSRMRNGGASRDELDAATADYLTRAGGLDVMQ